jgi:hypothetical protein
LKINQDEYDIINDDKNYLSLHLKLEKYQNQLLLQQIG